MCVDPATIISRYEHEISTMPGIISQGRSVIVYDLAYTPTEIFRMVDKYHKLVVKVHVNHLKDFIDIPSGISMDADYMHIQGNRDIVSSSLTTHKILESKFPDIEFHLRQSNIHNNEYAALNKLYLDSDLTPLPKSFFSSSKTVTVLVRDKNKEIQGAVSLLFIKNNAVCVLAGCLKRFLQGRGIIHKLLYLAFKFALTKVNCIWGIVDVKNHHVIKLFNYFNCTCDNSYKWIVFQKVL